MRASDLPVADYANNMRLIGHCDQGGRPDGMQLMVHCGYAYIAHMFLAGLLRRRCTWSAETPLYDTGAPRNTWNIDLEAADDLLFVINAKDMFAEASFAERAY
jgi:hypothetical protein